MNLSFRLVAGIALVGLAGCNVLPEPQGDTVRYFTLSSPASVSVPADATKVRPVQLAGYLRNRAMAVRVSENEVLYLEDVRWAESLADSITQLLRDKVGMVGGNRIVTVLVERCEANRANSNQLEFAATYTILSPGADRGVQHGAFNAPARTWDGKDHGALVAAMRAAVNELGDAIIADLAAKK